MNHYQSTQTKYCPNCGKPVELGSIYCENCGIQLDLFTDLNRSLESDRPTNENQARSDRDSLSGSTQFRKRKIASKWLILIPLFALVTVTFILILTQSSDRIKKVNTVSNPPQPTPVYIDTTTPSEKTQSIQQEPDTQIKVTSNPTEKPKSTITPTEFKCPGMPPSRVKVGDKVVVCSLERLIMREDHDLSGTIVRYFNPGTKGEIIDGPECADQSTWWKVKIFYNNILYEGWMKEGTDPKAKYFLCLDDEDS